ncbi:MAG: hypothetical protein IKE20_04105, partial [Eggerthellaceae bacterium]|nr:hypothetical protein [Eggerthellaceae bacterium]
MPVCYHCSANNPDSEEATMPVPKLTDEQRADALKKAAETRKARSEFRAKIKAGKVTAKKALAKRSD